MKKKKLASNPKPQALTQTQTSNIFLRNALLTEDISADTSTRTGNETLHHYMVAPWHIHAAHRQTCAYEQASCTCTRTHCCVNSRLICFSAICPDRNQERVNRKSNSRPPPQWPHCLPRQAEGWQVTWAVADLISPASGRPEQDPKDSRYINFQLI